MNTYNDRRTVMTLDAGGTNFVFSAIQGGKEVTASIVLPSFPLDLERCLETILNGFRAIKEQLLSRLLQLVLRFLTLLITRMGSLGIYLIFLRFEEEWPWGLCWSTFFRFQQ